MRKAIIIFIIAACGWSMASGQPSALVDSLYSESLNRTMPHSVLLPSGYDPTNTYPILYLFHGRAGNYQSWLNSSNIENHIDLFPMIVIMPEGEMSFFVNAYAEPKDRFEDYLINDLQAYVLQKYPVNPDQQAIAGFSQGGYGAMTLALRHPGLFRYVISICGAIGGVRDLEVIKTRPSIASLIPVFDKVFGKKPNDFRVAHDPFELYKKTPPENLPYVFIINGIHDHNRDLVATQKEFADSLKSYGAYYEYHEVPGGHNYSRTGAAALSLVFQRMVYLEENNPRSFTHLLERKIAAGGIVEAMVWYHRDIKMRENSPYNIDMVELNQLGYALISESKTDEAIAVFRLAIETFPKSANLYDSMSDAYLAKGDSANAIETVRDCLKLIDDDPYMSEDSKSQIKQIAEEKLKRLRGER